MLEARGKDYGVVVTDLKARNWEWWGVMDKYFIYDIDDQWNPIQPQEQPTEKTKAFNAICPGNSVYFRSGRGTQNPSIGIVRKNEEMLVLPAVDGWCEAAAVIKGEIVRGYISAKYVTPRETNTASTRAYPAYCSGSGVNVRTGRGTQHDSIGKAEKNAPMIAMPKENGWCQIAVALDGKITVGFMSATYVKSR